MPQLFIFGDSITWGAWDTKSGGWAQRLKAEVDRRIASRNFNLWCPVYSLGVSGDTSELLLQRIEPEIRARIEDKEDCTILIAIGINDSIEHLSDPSSTISPQAYTNNLEALLKIARNYSEKVAFIGLTPVNEELTKPVSWAPSLAYTLQRVKLFNDACADFCRASGSPFLDLMKPFIASHHQALLVDGVHPNADGHELIYNEVLSFFRERKLLSELF